MVCKHRFEINNGGLCIGWTGCIGTYTCSKCFATAKYGYNKSGDPIQILWIRESNGKFSKINKDAIIEFGNKEDRLIVGLKWSILKQKFVKSVGDGK
jgi:hypothetical protein